MKKSITYYCPCCYREFKTLDHFNRYVNRKAGRCYPLLMADGRRRLKVKKVDGYWKLVSKDTKPAPARKPVPLHEEYGTDTLKVGRSTVTVEWKVTKLGLFFDTFWDKQWDENSSFIAKAEAAVVSFLSKKLNTKFSITGGTGSKGYRSTSASISK